MDLRDKSLHRLMAKRRYLASGLPTDVQLDWAARCVRKAAMQQRNLFYVLANIWLLEVKSCYCAID